MPSCQCQSFLLWFKSRSILVQQRNVLSLFPLSPKKLSQSRGRYRLAQRFPSSQSRWLRPCLWLTRQLLFRPRQSSSSPCRPLCCPSWSQRLSASNQHPLLVSVLIASFWHIAHTCTWWLTRRGLLQGVLLNIVASVKSWNYVSSKNSFWLVCFCFCLTIIEVLYLGQQRVLLTQLSPLPVMLTLPHANSQQESASMFVLCWEIVLRPPESNGLLLSASWLCAHVFRLARLVKPGNLLCYIIRTEGQCKYLCYCLRLVWAESLTPSSRIWAWPVPAVWQQPKHQTAGAKTSTSTAFWWKSVPAQSLRLWTSYTILPWDSCIWAIEGEKKRLISVMTSYFNSFWPGQSRPLFFLAFFPFLFPPKNKWADVCAQDF